MVARRASSRGSSSALTRSSRQPIVHNGFKGAFHDQLMTRFNGSLIKTDFPKNSSFRFVNCTRIGEDQEETHRKDLSRMSEREALLVRFIFELIGIPHFVRDRQPSAHQPAQPTVPNVSPGMHHHVGAKVLAPRSIRAIEHSQHTDEDGLFCPLIGMAESED